MNFLHSGVFFATILEVKFLFFQSFSQETHIGVNVDRSQNRIQIGCVYVTYSRLTNSGFRLIWAKMNHFEAPLMK